MSGPGQKNPKQQKISDQSNAQSGTTNNLNDTFDSQTTIDKSTASIGSGSKDEDVVMEENKEIKDGSVDYWKSILKDCTGSFRLQWCAELLQKKGWTERWLPAVNFDGLMSDYKSEGLEENEAREIVKAVKSYTNKGGPYGAKPDLSKFPPRKCRRRSLGIDQVCGDLSCGCHDQTGRSSVDVYFSFENREAETAQLKEATFNLFQWWEEEGLKKQDAKTRGHCFFVCSGIRGSGKTTFTRKSFLKLSSSAGSTLSPSSSPTERRFEQLLKDCSPNLFRIGFEEIMEGARDKTAVLLLSEAIKYTTEFTSDTINKVRNLLSQSGDPRSLGLDDVFTYMFGPPPRKQNMVVIQFDEVNYLFEKGEEDTKKLDRRGYLLDLLNECYVYQKQSVQDSPTFLVVCLAGTNASQLDKFFSESRFNIRPFYLPPLHLKHLHNIIETVIGHSGQQKDVAEFQRLRSSDSELNLLNVLLQEVGGNPRLFSFAVEFLLLEATSALLQAKQLSSSDGAPVKKRNVIAVAPSELHLLLNGIQSLSADKIKDYSERLYEIASERGLDGTFKELFQKGMENLREAIFECAVVGRDVERNDVIVGDWKYERLQERGYAQLVPGSKRFTLRIPPLFLHRFNFKAKCDFPLLPSLHQGLELTPKDNERQDVAYMLLRVWSLWRSRPSERASLSLSDVLPCLPDRKFRCVDATFSLVHQMGRKIRPSSKSPTNRAQFCKRMESVLGNSDAVGCFAVAQDSFADAWLTLRLTTGDLFFLLVQSKRSVNLSRLSADCIREEYNKVAWLKKSFILLIISDGDAEAVPDDLREFVRTENGLDDQFYGPVLALRRLSSTVAELAEKTTSEAKAAFKSLGPKMSMDLNDDFKKTKVKNKKTKIDDTELKLGEDSGYADDGHDSGGGAVCKCGPTCKCMKCVCWKTNQCLNCTHPCHDLSEDEDGE